MLKTLDRYIFKTIIPPFLFGILIFVSIFVVDLFMQLMDLAVERSLSFSLMIQLFLLKLPEVIVLTLPMGTLFSVIVGFGQLSSASEVTAFKAGGISIYRQVAPVVLFTLAIAIGGFYINESLVPRCNQKFNQIFKVEVTLKNPIPQISHSEVFELGNGQKFYVNRYDYKIKRMYGVIMVTGETGQFPRTVSAREAQLFEGYCQFESGRISFLNKMGVEDRFILFEKLRYPIDTYKIDPRHLDQDNSKPNQMTYYELQGYIKNLESRGVDSRFLVEYEVELYSKLALPLASCIFALIGIPFSLTHHRSQASSGAGLSIIIIFAYYILMSFGKAIARSYLISPFWGAFFPNVFFLIIGGILIYWKRN